MRKLKKGDVVIIQPDVDVGLLRNVSPGFTREMDRFIGKKGMITEREDIDGCFHLFGYSFRSEWLKLLANEVTIVEED